MQREGRKSLLQEGLNAEDLRDKREVDLRYVGQASTIRVEWSGPDTMRQAFQALHERRYGHALDEEIELVNLHVSVHAPSSMPALPKIDQTPARPVGTQAVYAAGQQVPVYERLSLGVGQTLHGPVILIEPSATTWVKPGWQVMVNMHGSLEITRE